MSSGLGNRICISDSSFNIMSVIFSQPKNLNIFVSGNKAQSAQVVLFFNHLIKTKMAVFFFLFIDPSTIFI